MAAAANISGLLIDAGSNTEAFMLYNTPTDIVGDEETDGEDSNTSDADDLLDADVHPQQIKIQAQREVFERHLKVARPSVLVEKSDDVENKVNTSMRKSAKIIDEVRNYQQELFERALDENVIAVLDTGSGKTLIACLLIRHVLDEEVINRATGKRSRIVFFLANSVHLVQQQARVLANNLAVKPIIITGNDRSESWRGFAMWAQVLENPRPIVCTPAILSQALDAALVRIDQVALLVFDEAHHAKKDHPYSQIIRSHYLKCDAQVRPRIFGMTASPVDSKGDINDGIRDLEEMLHCKVVTTRDPSKLSFVPKPANVVWRYTRLQSQPQTDLCQALSVKLKHSRDTRKGFAFSRDAVTTLGPWCADRVWKYVVGASEHTTSKIIKTFEQSIEYATMDDICQRNTAIEDLQEAIALVLESEQKAPLPNASYLSPKVLKLYDELTKIYSAQPQAHSIVFVDQRLTALVLHDCFQFLKVPHIRPAVLLGSASDSTSLRKQEQFLDDFRAGLINVIFATSVADEGIDIPQCNVCIRFDLYKSPIQYIQSRGRARMKNSMYAHMVEEGNVRHQTELNYAINCDSYVIDYCQRLDPDRLLGRGIKLDQMIARDSTKRNFKTATGAICDYGNSLLVLSRFASSLQYIGALEKESYEEEIDEVDRLFKYTVRLPVLPEIEIIGARGEWKPNKQLARRSAAWNCCFLLRRAGLLDEDLTSPHKKKKPDNLNARLAITEKKSSYSMFIKPSLWQNGLGSSPTKLYVSVIKFIPKSPLHREHSPIVLLTRSRLPQLPPFMVYLEDAIETEILISNDCQVLYVSSAEVDLLSAFTFGTVFQDVFNKTYEIDSMRISYWFAPISPSYSCTSQDMWDILDRDAMKATQLGRIQWTPGDTALGKWTEGFACDPRNGKFHYFTGSVATGMSIFDPVPSSVPQIQHKSTRSIIDFTDSFWKASKDKFAQSTYDSKQEILHAELVSTRRNFLECGTAKERAQVNCFVAPQPLELSRLYPNFVASCLVWPAILHRLEAYLIALEAFEELGLSGVPADLALEAFTKDNDNEDQEHQTHIGGHHGMGKNYERLEFLGDSLLKMMTTITVFNRTNCDEEGMHCRRMEILCNRRLFDVSTQKHHLYQYARTKGFNRDTWYPENLVLLKGRGVKKIPEPVKHSEVHQDLGMKTIADISEAIIGAAVLSSRHSLNPFDLGIRAITQLVDSDDHQITSWEDIAKMYAAPEWSLRTNDIQANKLAENVAARTGYHFKHPRLLRSAFTHSSDINATVPDLQRLEFLGDAVLDWVSISWLFNSNPNRNPQWLTEHKMAMVSNKFLAALAVVLDFDKYIYCSTAKLFADITMYAKNVRDVYAAKGTTRDFWTRIDSPPKALSDLVESYIGALLIDSGFNYGEVEEFFNKHIVWFFEDISKYDDFANRQPTTFLYKRLTDEFKCRDFRVFADNIDEGLVEPRVMAGVVIHEQMFADAIGTNSRHARAKVSQKVLSSLKDMSIEEFRSKFGCDCKVRAD